MVTLILKCPIVNNQCISDARWGHDLRIKSVSPTGSDLCVTGTTLLLGLSNNARSRLTNYLFIVSLLAFLLNLFYFSTQRQIILLQVVI